MFYVQFKRESSDDGNLYDMLGSDGVFILDGRNNLDTMIEDSYKRINQMKNIHPNIAAFEIFKGNRIDDNNESLWFELT